jgi:hypothetical protein
LNVSRRNYVKIVLIIVNEVPANNHGGYSSNTDSDYRVINKYTNNDNVYSRTIEQDKSYYIGDSDEIINHTRNVLGRSKGSYEESKLTKPLLCSSVTPVRDIPVYVDPQPRPDPSIEYLERIAFLEGELRMKDQKINDLDNELQRMNIENSKLDQRLHCEIDKNDHIVEDKHRAISRSNQDYTDLNGKYELLEREFNYLEYQFKRSEEIRIEQSILIKKLQKEIDIIRGSAEVETRERIRSAEFSDGESTERPRKKVKSVDKSGKKVVKKKTKVMGNNSTTMKTVKKAVSPPKGIIKSKK